MTTTSDGRPPGKASTKGASTPVKGETPSTKSETAPTQPVAASSKGTAAPKDTEAPLQRATAPTRPVTAGPPGAVITPAPSGGVALPRQRRVHLTVNRIDPWTVLRLSFLLSVASAIITVVALMLLWIMLSAGGVFTSVDDSLESVLGDGALTLTQYFSFGKVLSVALLIGAIDVVLITALATIGAFLFNLAASMVGGLEVSATEEA